MHRRFALGVPLQRGAATGSDNRVGQWARKHHVFHYLYLQYPPLLSRFQDTLEFPPPPLSLLRPVTGKLEEVGDCVARLECADSSRSVLLSIPATPIFPTLTWRYVIESWRRYARNTMLWLRFSASTTMHRLVMMMCHPPGCQATQQRELIANCGRGLRALPRQLPPPRYAPPT